MTERLLLSVLSSSQENRRVQGPDLVCLNTAIGSSTFCMLMIKQLLELVQPRDWFTTINLKKAYDHVSPTKGKSTNKTTSHEVTLASPIHLVSVWMQCWKHCAPKAWFVAWHSILSAPIKRTVRVFWWWRGWQGPVQEATRWMAASASHKSIAPPPVVCAVSTALFSGLCWEHRHPGRCYVHSFFWKNGNGYSRNIQLEYILYKL